jgi:hypothetical protein
MSTAEPKTRRLWGCDWIAVKKPLFHTGGWMGIGREMSGVGGKQIAAKGRDGKANRFAFDDHFFPVSSTVRVWAPVMAVPKNAPTASAFF